MEELIHVKVRAGSSGPSLQQQHEPFAKLRRQLFRTALEQVNQSLPEVWEISRTLFQSLDLKSRVVANTAERNTHLSVDKENVFSGFTLIARSL